MPYFIQLMLLKTNFTLKNYTIHYRNVRSISWCPTRGEYRATLGDWVGNGRTPSWFFFLENIGLSLGNPQNENTRNQLGGRDHFQNCYIFVTPVVANEMKWIGEDGEMIEMTLSSRHRIRNSSPRPSTLPLSHGRVLHVDGGETFLFLSNRQDREPNPKL